MLDWEQWREQLAGVERILLTCHVRPDGDSLGSEIGMAELLRQLGKQVAIFNPSPTPSRYRFLDATGTLLQGLDTTIPIEQQTLPSDFQMLVILDTGSWSQLAGLAAWVKQSLVPRVIIDHHRTQSEDLEALRLVDVEASACGLLVYRAYRHFQIPITSLAADAMFIAIASDTGWMHHPNTTAEVLEVQADLIRHGAQPAELYRLLYEQNSLARLRLLQHLVSNIQLYADGTVCASHISLQEIAAAQAHPMETEDLIGFLTSLAKVELAILLIEQANGGTKFSLRSRHAVDCSKLAEQFGGGGHKAAAGATVTNPLQETRQLVLQAALATLAATSPSTENAIMTD